jgi:hypothetical protein
VDFQFSCFSSTRIFSDEKKKVVSFRRNKYPISYDLRILKNYSTLPRANRASIASSEKQVAEISV